MAIAISARILGNGKRESLRGSGKSFRPSRYFRSCRSFEASKSLRRSEFI